MDRLDVLVNNAGISPSLAPPTDTGVEEYRRTYETNVFGVVAVTNAFLPSLPRSPRPRIGNISSGTASLTWNTTPNPSSLREAAAAPTGRPRPPSMPSPSSTPRRWLRTASRSTRSPRPAGHRSQPRAAAAAGDPAEAAQGALRLALLPDDGPTGGFFSWDGTPVPW